MASTRDRIIQATLTLISEQGLSDVTMIDIARSAEVARQTLYNHYPDIDSILADAASQHNEQSITELRSAVAIVDTPPARIEQLARHIAQVSTHTGHDIDIHHALAPQHRDALNDYHRAIDDMVGDTLAEGIKDGSFRSDLDLTIDTSLTRQLLTGISSLVSTTPDEAPAIARTATRTILAALTDPQAQ
jgi:AcrR family transcriptional regulator